MDETTPATEATRYLNAIDLLRVLELGVKWRSEPDEVGALSPVPEAGALRYADLRSDRHLHSVYSDGHNTIAEMAEGARVLGLDEIVVTDHSHLVNAAEFSQQHAEIDAINEFYASRGIAFQVVKGIEVNILHDGSLDLPDAELSLFEAVNAGINVDPSVDASARYLRALENPYVTALAHPHTGGDVVDWLRLAHAAKERGVALEVNGRHIFLRGTGHAAEKMIDAAKAEGVAIQIASDAHNEADFVDGLYGVRFAAQAGVTAIDLLPAQRRHYDLPIAA
jgi:DNA polymerase (family X)